MCTSDDSPAVIADLYGFISITNFFARSPSFGSLIIMENNLTRNLDNAIFTCRSVSIFGEVYDSQQMPFRVLCKFVLIMLVIE